jgi:hypothetical protein
MSVNPTTHTNPAVAQVTGAIRQAAQVTGSSFGYLLATAKVESNFDPGAKASTSSARGLFQFIDQTWLTTMKEAGPGLGFGRYADAITQTPSGRLEVSDPALRTKILDLRQDPAANSLMAGAFTAKNAALLSSRLGRQATEGELYIAHFLGASGAAKLIEAASTSQSNAAALFPDAANANPSIFYDRAGRARSAAEVYANLTGRYDVARVGAAASVASIAPAQRVAALVPDTAGLANAFAAQQPAPARLDDEPVFQALFRSSERKHPLAPVVNQLWGTHAAQATTRNASLATDATASDSGGGLDLFRDMRPDIGGLFSGKS